MRVCDCMYISVYVCLLVCINVCVYVCVYVYMHACAMALHVYACTYIYIHRALFMYAHSFFQAAFGCSTNTRVFAAVRVYIRLGLHTCAYICLCPYTYTCIRLVMHLGTKTLCVSIHIDEHTSGSIHRYAYVRQHT
jgi:hypothetical protein